MNTTRPRPSGVAFVAIPVTDINRAVTFYHDILGLEITRDQRAENQDWVEFDAGGVCIGLVRPDAYGGQFQPIKFACLALHVPDVPGILAFLKDKGIEAHHEDTGVCHMIFFDDTEGNGVCLHNRYAPED